MAILQDSCMPHVEIVIGFSNFSSFVYEHLYIFCICNGYISISAVFIKYNILYTTRFNVRHMNVVTTFITRLSFNVFSFVVEIIQC